MISIGGVGAGLYGRMQLEAFRQRERLAGDMRVAGFAEIDEAARLSAEADFGLRGYGSVGDLLRSERLVCLSVVTPDHLHHAPAIGFDETVVYKENREHIKAVLPMPAFTNETIHHDFLALMEAGKTV